jgi:AcrR family transcriptional regulator
MHMQTASAGVDAITTEAGVAKMTMYRNFASKEDLAIAYLELREERWTRGWLKAEVRSRAEHPAQRLLAIFDVFSEWFARADYEGCVFVSVMLDPDDAVIRIDSRSVADFGACRRPRNSSACCVGLPCASRALA